MLGVFFQSVPQRAFTEKDHPLQVSFAIGTSRRQHDWLIVRAGFQKLAEWQKLGVAIDKDVNRHESVNSPNLRRREVDRQ